MQGDDVVVITVTVFTVITATVIWLVLRIRQSNALRSRLSEEYRRALEEEEEQEKRRQAAPPKSDTRESKR